MAGTKPAARLPSGLGSLSSQASESVIIRSGLRGFHGEARRQARNHADAGAQHFAVVGEGLAGRDDAQFGQGVISCCCHCFSLLADQ